ncbi:MAG: enolase [Caldilineaceae bacterium]|nr:enolase [Caldilineaceae bacterium]
MIAPGLYPPHELPDDDSLTVARVATTVFRLPMYGALRWGKSSALNEARHVLVEVELSDGATGMAEAPPRPTIYGETAETICAIIRTELAPRLLGASPAAGRPRLAEIANNHVARGALDIALHNAVAQSRGITPAEHMGATRDRIKASYILGLGQEDAVLAEAQRVYQQGVRVFKVKVGRDWEDDLRRIRRLQAELPSDLALYADANQCLAPGDAARRLAILQDLGLLYCEEPLPVEQVHARAALRRESRLPIIGDDSCFTPRDLQRELALDTFDILNIKTPRTGYSDSLAMAAAAVAAGKSIMVGSQAAAGLGAAQAALFAARSESTHPAEISFFLKLKEDIIDRPIPIIDGWVKLKDAAAVRVDRARLREQGVSHE